MYRFKPDLFPQANQRGSMTHAFYSVGALSRASERNPRRGAGGGGAEPRALQFTRLNWALLGTAALLMVFGYMALASNSPVLSTVIAPLLLVASYVVLIPLGLIL